MVKAARPRYSAPNLVPLSDASPPASPGPGSAAPSEAARTCSACAKPLAPDAARCSNCGTPISEAFRCPHCRALADVLPSPNLRFVCGVCGRPRIPVDNMRSAWTFPELPSLCRAARENEKARRWRVVACAVAAFGVLALAVLAAIASAAEPSPAVVVEAGVAVAIPFGFAILARERARASRGRARQGLEDAWRAAAIEIARASGGVLSARSFSERTRLPAAEAERMLAHLTASGALLARVADDGSLRYRLLETSLDELEPNDAPPAS